MRVLALDTAETFYSLRDRIMRGARERIVLVVPEGAAVLGGVDLPLLRRLADRERLEIGLVTSDRDLARRARGLGLPAFSSLLLAEHYRPGWWRGRRPALRLGLAGGDWLVGEEAHAKNAKSVKKNQEGRSGRDLFLIVVLLLVLLALPMGMAVYALPAATVTLRPATQTAQVIVEVSDLPARPVSLSLPWEATAPGTGTAARQSARALALQALSAAASGQLAARLAPGEALVPGSVRVTLADEATTTAGGLTHLRLTAALEGAAVAESEVVRRVFPALAAALPDGYAVDPATLVIQMEAGNDAARPLVTARASGRATIDPTALAGQLAGRSLSQATRVLDALPLAAPPTLDLSPWPGAWGRLPFRPERIRVELAP